MKALLYNALLRRYPCFTGDGELYGSSVEPASIGFCLVFRHDMDLIDTHEAFDTFLERDAKLGVHSSLYFLLADLRVLRERVPMARERGYEVQLHSEAKPGLAWSNRLISMEGYLMQGYARKLDIQQREFERLVGAEHIAGHCPHAGNNYLYFANYLNWNIIERSSLEAGYAYLSDWRIPARTAEGEEFPEPLPAHWHIHRDGRRLLVLPTQWDDKYYATNFEDLYLRRRPRRVVDCEAAFASAVTQAERCRSTDVPMIVNLHPVHMLHPERNVFALKEQLVEWAAANDVPVRTPLELYHEATR